MPADKLRGPPGGRRAPGPRASASRAKAGAGSCSRGATAIRPRSRSPGAGRDGVGQTGDVVRHGPAALAELPLRPAEVDLE